jgi:hypothetical protein
VSADQAAADGGIGHPEGVGDGLTPGNCSN